MGKETWMSIAQNERSFFTPIQKNSELCFLDLFPDTIHHAFDSIHIKEE